jgi:hypothetical protein
MEEEGFDEKRIVSFLKVAGVERLRTPSTAS